MASGKLIEEISNLDKPERFKPYQVDEIINRYVPEGMTKAKAKEVLTSEGLQISEVNSKDRLPNCLGCDDIAIEAGYGFGSFFQIMPPSRSLVVNIGFRKGRVAMVRGWYVTHVY